MSVNIHNKKGAENNRG